MLRPKISNIFLHICKFKANGDFCHFSVPKGVSCPLVSISSFQCHPKACGFIKSLPSREAPFSFQSVLLKKNFMRSWLNRIMPLCFRSTLLSKVKCCSCYVLLNNNFLHNCLFHYFILSPAAPFQATLHLRLLLCQLCLLPCV